MTSHILPPRSPRLQDIFTMNNTFLTRTCCISPQSARDNPHDRAFFSDPEVLELFSRGQNPQDWHLAKRGLGLDENGSALDGNVYMQIGRKEATLSDVDNELAGVIRRFMESQ